MNGDFVLVMHVDAGWNSELAVNNIEALIKHCNYDLHIMWLTGMRCVNSASLYEVSIANQDVLKITSFFQSLSLRRQNRIRYICLGAIQQRRAFSFVLHKRNGCD